MVEGGCLCGAIRYRSTSAPERVVHCHCSMCRRMSGAAFLTVVGFAKDDFCWSKGEPRFYRSSDQAQRGFCPDCGSTLSYHLRTEDWRVFVTVGTLDRPNDVRPEEHCFYDYKLSWLSVDDGLPRLARGRYARDVSREDESSNR
jgi:hypothetical protein